LRRKKKIGGGKKKKKKHTSGKGGGGTKRKEGRTVGTQHQKGPGPTWGGKADRPRTEKRKLLTGGGGGVFEGEGKGLMGGGPEKQIAYLGGENKGKGQRVKRNKRLDKPGCGQKKRKTKSRERGKIVTKNVKCHIEEKDLCQSRKKRVKGEESSID